MELLKNKLHKSHSLGWVDVHLLIDCFNIIHDKSNELIIENKVLKEKLQNLEKRIKILEIYSKRPKEKINPYDLNSVHKNK